MRATLLASVAILALGVAGPAFAASTDFNTTATTAAALTVACADALRFGSVAVEPNNASATITVAPTIGAVAVSSSTADIYALGTSGPADCTVANETGGNATASLAASTGTFAGTTLSGVLIGDGGAGTLSADINLSTATGIGNQVVYIGGVLTIPAAYTDFNAYSQPITLTVTD